MIKRVDNHVLPKDSKTQTASTSQLRSTPPSKKILDQSMKENASLNQNQINVSPNFAIEKKRNAVFKSPITTSAINLLTSNLQVETSLWIKKLDTLESSLKLGSPIKVGLFLNDNIISGGIEWWW